MNLPKEGSSTACPLMLLPNNFPHWKACMGFFLKSIDKRVWSSMMDGYTLTIIVTEGVSTPKLVDS